MEKIEIEQIVKDYLITKNIDFEPKCEKDKFSIYIEEFDKVFFIRCAIKFYKGVCYPAQAEGYPANKCSIAYYTLVIDENGKVLVDLAKIFPWEEGIQLDENNIIVPIVKDNEFGNNMRHFRIQNNEAKLINTFKSLSRYDEELLKDKLIICEGKLYNFETGAILCDSFDEILSTHEKDLADLAVNLQIPLEDRKEFINAISQKMKEEDLLIGYKKIKVEKAEFKLTNSIFVFINKKGNFVSSLYHIDDYDLKSIDGVDSLNMETIIGQIKNKLFKRIDELILREEKKKQILSQIKMKLSL